VLAKLDARVAMSTGENDDAAKAHSPGPPSGDDRPAAEHRLLPSLTVLVLIVLPFLVPVHLFSPGHWILGGLGFALLVAIVVVDPGKVDGLSPLVRGLSIVLTFLLVTAASLVTVSLVLNLVTGAGDFDSPASLLATGALVWIDANLTFSLLYWELDGGGAAQRFHGQRRYPDLAFPQHMNPELAKPRWRPTFVDYLYLGLTNSLAFSPTDVMPLTHWTKMSMSAQSLISLAILSLAIANAVNLLN
jgi:uncharacterized membrane protein